MIPSSYLHFQTHAPTTIIPEARISVQVIVGIVKVVELPLVTRHRWELPLPAFMGAPLPASVVAVNRIHQ